MLSGLVAFVAVHQAQAQNAPRVGWIFPTASAANSFKLASSKDFLRDLGYIEGRNIGKNSPGKISLADGLGGERCGMSPEEFAKFYPPLIDWIRNTLTASAHVAQTVASRGFSGYRSILQKRPWRRQKLFLSTRCQCHPYHLWG